MACRTRGLSLAILCAGVFALGACGGDEATSGDGSYAAYNLFTGAPRFAIFKASPDRDLCVRVVFIWGGADGTVELADTLTTESVSVTHRAADCSPGDGGAAPSLEPQGIPAQSVTGTATVTRYPEGDTYRWTVSIDGVVAFSPDQEWVPETEPVDAEDIEIVGGCC